MTDKLDSLLSELDARNGLGVRIIRNEKTGAVGYLPVTVADADEWERACGAMHDAQKRAYSHFQKDEQSESPTRLIWG